MANGAPRLTTTLLTRARLIAQTLEAEGYATGVSGSPTAFARRLLAQLGNQGVAKMDALYQEIRAVAGANPNAESLAAAAAEIGNRPEGRFLLAAREAADDLLEVARPPAARGALAELLVGAEAEHGPKGSFLRRAVRRGPFGRTSFERVSEAVTESPGTGSVRGLRFGATRPPGETGGMLEALLSGAQRSEPLAPPRESLLGAPYSYRVERGIIGHQRETRRILEAILAGTIPEGGELQTEWGERLVREALATERATGEAGRQVRFGTPRPPGPPGRLAQAVAREGGQGFFGELMAGMRETERAGRRTPRAGYLGSGGVGAGARGLRRAGRFVGRHAGPIGLGLEALFLAKSLHKGLVEEPRKARAVEAIPAATPESVLRDLRQQELLARRQARLARQDPEAYQMLTELLGGGMPRPRLARGEFVVGGQAPAPVGSDEIQNLLAMMQ